MRIIVILLFLGLSLPSISQGYYWQSGSKEKKLKNLSVNGGVGLRMYFGDIQKKGSVFNKPKLAYGIGVRYQMRPKFGLSLGLEGRGMKGRQSTVVIRMP